MDRWPQVAPLRDSIATLNRQLKDLRKQRNELILAMVRAGYTRREVAAAWSISYASVTKVVDDHGGTRRVMGFTADPPIATAPQRPTPR